MSGQFPLLNDSQQFPPTAELLALEDLRKIGVQELRGCAIDTLIKIAHRRQIALKYLQEAEEKICGSTDEKEIPDIFENVLSELESVEKAYPNTSAFDLRRIEVKSDIMRARSLQSIYRNRMRARGMEMVADFYAKVHIGDEKSLADARGAWNKIKEMASEYSDIFSDDALDKMNRVLQAATTRYIDDRVEHINYFLKQAQAYQDDHHPLAAMDCLAHSQNILDKLQQEPEQVGSVSGVQQSQIQEIKGKIDSQKGQITKLLPQLLVEQRKHRFDTLQREVQRGLGDSHRLSNPVNILEDVKCNEGIRKKLDEMYFLFPLMGEMDIPDHLQTLLRTRQSRLLQSDLLYRQVSDILDNQNQIPANLAYWVWSRGQLAYKYNPDSYEVKQRHKLIKENWENIDSQFNEFIRQVRTFLDKLENRIENRDRFRRETEHLSNLSPIKLLEKAEQSLAKAQKMLSEQVEKPGMWQSEIQKVQTRYETQKKHHERLRSFAEQSDVLVKAWEENKTEKSNLLKETKEFLGKTDVPDSSKHRLRQAVKNAITNPGIDTFEKPSLALLAYKIGTDIE